MLIATTVMLVGLVIGVGAAQLAGLRLGGVIVVPLVSVYLLRSFATFPVFLASVGAAYVSLRVIKNRVLLYGRPVFVVSVLIGALVPVLVFEFLAIAAGIDIGLTQVEFVGSVLPGIAAYNYHRIDAEKRVLDMVWSLATVLLLTVVGIGLVILVGLSPLAGALPPLLLGPNSDIAVAFDLVVDRPNLPVLASDTLAVSLLSVGLLVSEALRSRYGLRIGGVIVVPLIVLIAFRNGWMLPLWIGTAATAYLAVQFVHWWTLLYGRVVLGLGVIVGLLGSISAVTVVPVQHGLLPFFVGILGGVTGYNLHVVPPAERRANLFVTGGVFVTVVAIARLFVIPPASGLLQYVSGRHVAAGAVCCLPALYELYHLERLRPDDEITVAPEATGPDPSEEL
ncbi:poly-gamma-glutamate biosynthesis protein PgsC/CapC [Haloarcula halophila]|uniref:poly-gamma-glutamate biosynthesis protein PgsC/CapC n=1 Tax=Haloarcula TaxID=2237 RepID=UPI0023E468E5|nr:poly-gamma-glutamate biosynthesis protein PgsC/CapC [Halomicroarcula sp. DFY41]